MHGDVMLGRAVSRDNSEHRARLPQTSTSWLFLQLRQWARSAARDARALHLAARDPRVPGFAKAMAWLVAAYGVSHIDLVPEFVPVLLYLDDLIIVSLTSKLVARMIPAEVMGEHRRTAATRAR